MSKKKSTSNSSLARALVRNAGAYKVTGSEIAKYGGHWSDEYALYVFPDGSTGAFTDISHGAQEKTRAGESVLHFAAGD